MTDEPALLAAVAAAPDDDTPRLVFADWLDDRGRGERAEYVRTQCRLAAATPADDAYYDLLDRQDELAEWLKVHEPLGPARPDGALRVGGHHYEGHARGFPDDVAFAFSLVGPLEFPVVLKALAAHLPKSTARSLRAFGLTADQAAELVRHPLVAGLRGLELNVAEEAPEFDYQEDDGRARMVVRGAGGNAVAAAVAASPHLTNLRRLKLHVDLTDESAALLARADLPALADLHLGVSVGAPRAVRALAGAAWFTNVRVLGVGQHLGVAHLEALVALPPFPHLHTLDLADNRFEWIALRALADSKAFPHLARLDLSRNPVGAEGVAYLGKAPWSVRDLGLRGCGLDAADVKALLSGQLLDGVRALELGGNDLPAASVALLAEAPQLAHVRQLGLAHSRPGPAGLAALGRSKNFRHLTRLDLGAFADERGKVKTEDVAAFLTALDAPNLRHLHLDGYPVGVAGAKALAGRAAFGALRRLHLQDGRIGNAGLAALAASPHLRELVVLDLWTNGIISAPALLDAATFPRLARCVLTGNKIPKAHAAELTARRGVVIERIG